MNIKTYIPNTITCANLFCGCLGILYALKGDMQTTAILIAIAAVLDFLDGMTARLLKAYSSIGKELDSMADMVTFGVLPGIVMFKLMQMAGMEEPYTYIAFLISIFSGLRLAKFNVDTRQSESFIGVPTPAGCLFIISLALIVVNNKYNLASTIQQPAVLIGITLLLSYLLVAELPLFALKFKTWGWAGNQIRWSFIAISAVLFALFFYAAVPLIILFYVVLSLFSGAKINPPKPVK
jgi:CDP-diacylglycerol--serine O-phosphatidyltransferase